MNLKILLPFQIFAEKTDVLRIVAETSDGSFGILPHRLDCVAALIPGILVYEIKDQGEAYLAVDEGVLVKAGMEVLIAVRNAISGTDLSKLREAVKLEFTKLNEQEQSTCLALTKMESSLIHRLAEFSHE